jgi:ribonuclease Z
MLVCCTLLVTACCVRNCRRYVFNAAEGLQRVVTEHHLRTAKVGHIFCTEVSFNCLGGLPGMLLTIADAKRASVALYGPDGLATFLATTRRFMRGSVARVLWPQWR